MACIFQHLRTIWFEFINLCMYVSLSGQNLRRNQTCATPFYFHNCLMGRPNSRFHNVSELFQMHAHVIQSFACCAFFLNSLVWSLSISSISHHRFLSPPTHETLAFFSSSFFEHVCYSVHVCCRVHVYKAGCFIRKRPIKLSYHYINWSH